MFRVQYKTTRIVLVLISIVTIYFTIKVHKYEHNSHAVLTNVHPNDVWEFVADFSHMKYLNPTLIDFNVIDESGNYNHWKYSVEYTERLYHWPYSKHHSIGHFIIKKDEKRDVYVIDSMHTTCLLFGILCFDSESTFKFAHTTGSEGCLYEENVIYQCTTLLSSLCRREITSQRNAIIKNLKNHFLKKKFYGS